MRQLDVAVWKDAVVESLGRPAFIHCYSWAACSVIGWQAELVAVGRMTTCWFLVVAHCSHVERPVFYFMARFHSLFVGMLFRKTGKILRLKGNKKLKQVCS
jgi:hypothetical protein